MLWMLGIWFVPSPQSTNFVSLRVNSTFLSLRFIIFSVTFQFVFLINIKVWVHFIWSWTFRKIINILLFLNGKIDQQKINENHESMKLVIIKDDTLHSLKNSTFYLKTSHFMNKEEPPQAATLPVEPFGTQLSSNFQHFTLLGPKLTDVTIWSKILSSIQIPITIIVAERWFLQHVRVYNYCRCSVCCTTEVKDL